MSHQKQHCQLCNSELSPAQIEQRERGKRHGKIGAILGATFGLMGAVAGLYFGGFA